MKAWVGRNKDGALWLYGGKPHKESGFWSFHIMCAAMLDHEYFHSVTWEDEEPTEVEIIIKPKKK